MLPHCIAHNRYTVEVISNLPVEMCRLRSNCDDKEDFDFAPLSTQQMDLWIETATKEAYPLCNWHKVGIYVRLCDKGR